MQPFGGQSSLAPCQLPRNSHIQPARPLLDFYDSLWISVSTEEERIPLPTGPFILTKTL